MADLVSNALSINSQQTQSNNGTYQKRLQGTQIAAPSSVGSDLARALGVLGGVVDQTLQDQEKRNERLGIDAAEKIIAGQTDADMNKLTAIEMIGNYTPDKQLQDNPYALVTIEKQRGSYIAAQGHDEYNEWRSQQTPVKTASEEITRYNGFMSKKKQEALSTTTNPQAFDKGFNEKSVPNQLAVAGQQRTEQALELRAIQKGTMQSAIGQLVQDSDKQDDTTFNANLNNIFKDARITWMSIPDRVAFANEAMKGIATTTGDFHRLDEIAKYVVIGADAKGNEIKLGDVTDNTAYKQVAEQRTSQIYGENLQKSLKTLQGMSVPEQNAWFAQQTPEWANVLTPYRDNMIKFREGIG